MYKFDTDRETITKILDSVFEDDKKLTFRVSAKSSDKKEFNSSDELTR